MKKTGVLLVAFLMAPFAFAGPDHVVSQETEAVSPSDPVSSEASSPDPSVAAKKILKKEKLDAYEMEQSPSVSPPASPVSPKKASKQKDLNAFEYTENSSPTLDKNDSDNDDSDNASLKHRPSKKIEFRVTDPVVSSPAVPSAPKKLSKQQDLNTFEYNDSADKDNSSSDGSGDAVKKHHPKKVESRISDGSSQSTDPVYSAPLPAKKPSKQDQLNAFEYNGSADQDNSSSDGSGDAVKKHHPKKNQSRISDGSSQSTDPVYSSPLPAKKPSKKDELKAFEYNGSADQDNSSSNGSGDAVKKHHPKKVESRVSDGSSQSTDPVYSAPLPAKKPSKQDQLNAFEYNGSADQDNSNGDGDDSGDVVKKHHPKKVESRISDGSSQSVDPVVSSPAAPSAPKKLSKQQSLNAFEYNDSADQDNSNGDGSGNSTKKHSPPKKIESRISSDGSSQSQSADPVYSPLPSKKPSKQDQLNAFEYNGSTDQDNPNVGQDNAGTPAPTYRHKKIESLQSEELSKSDTAPVEEETDLPKAPGPVRMNVVQKQDESTAPVIQSNAVSSTNGDSEKVPDVVDRIGPNKFQAFQDMGTKPNFIQVNVKDYNVRSTPIFTVKDKDNIVQQTNKGDVFPVLRTVAMKDPEAVAVAVDLGDGKESWIYAPQHLDYFRFCEVADCFKEKVDTWTKTIGALNGGNATTMVMKQNCAPDAATISRPRNMKDVAPAPKPAVTAVSESHPIPPLPIPTVSKSQIGKDLWGSYQTFARNFYNQYGKNATHSNAAYTRELFISALIKNFGQKKASYILEALTAWREAPDRKDRPAQIADIAAVMKVVENRTLNKYPGTAFDLLDIGIPKSQQNQRLRVLLARSQFSVLNDGDPNLLTILKYNPDQKNNAKLRTAFETIDKIDDGEVQFRGALNSTKVQHYHANYISPPDWATVSPIQHPTVRVVDKDASGQSYATDVDLSSLPGSKHYFYEGVR